MHRGVKHLLNPKWSGSLFKKIRHWKIIITIDEEDYRCLYVHEHEQESLSHYFYNLCKAVREHPPLSVKVLLACFSAIKRVGSNRFSFFDPPQPSLQNDLVSLLSLLKVRHAPFLGLLYPNKSRSYVTYQASSFDKQQ